VIIQTNALTLFKKIQGISNFNCGRVHPVAYVSQINTIKPHSQLSLMCIYCTRTLTTCFGFNEPSSGEFHIQYTKLQAKCYKFYKSLKRVLKHVRSIKSTP
jgi:hypothetical protein